MRYAGHPEKRTVTRQEAEREISVDRPSVMRSMTSLPSYQEATGRVDWLELAAPYVSLEDYPALCLVSKRFYSHFAPRLWNDPQRFAHLVKLSDHDGQYSACFALTPVPSPFSVCL